MKIDGSRMQQILTAYRSQPKKPIQSPGSAPAPTDRLDLSEKAGEILQAREAYDSLPDVREAKVAEIRARIADGTYPLDNEQIAEAFLRGVSGK
jgi:negative regulator of flagellin synthesis FlgM